VESCAKCGISFKEANELGRIFSRDPDLKEMVCAPSCTHTDLSYLQKDGADLFIGLSDAESLALQFNEWCKGRPLHNPIRNECCIDFSCCCKNQGEPTSEQIDREKVRISEIRPDVFDLISNPNQLR